MGTASLVIGIVCAVIAVVPCCNIIAVIPSLIGLALGVCAMTGKDNDRAPQSHRIAGVVLNGAALLIIAVWTLMGALLIFLGNEKDGICDDPDTYSADHSSAHVESKP